VPDSSAAGFQKIAAQVQGPGVFTIDGIPAATTYMLRVVAGTGKPTFYVTDQRDLDLGLVRIGRVGPSAVTKQTNVTFQISGMTAWQAPDYLLVDSFSVDTENFVGNPVAPANPPKLGDTSTSITIDWQNSYGFVTPAMLVDAAHHDDVWLTHNVSTVINDQSNHPYVGQRTADVFTSTDVAMVNGQPVTVTGAFTTLPTSSGQSYTASLADLRTAISDGNHYSSEDLNCGILTNPAASYGNGIGPTFGSFDGDPTGNWTPVGQANVTLGPIAYSDPYPTSWPQVMPCGLARFRLIKAPGATKPIGTKSHVINVWDNVANPYTFHSQGHAPTNITVAGKPLLEGGAVAFDGTAPVTLSWSAVPMTDFYTVDVDEITRDVTKSVRTQVASLATTQTSIAIPGDVFQKGHLYLFTVGEIRQNASYSTGHLNRTSTPHSGGRVTSGLFRLSNACGNGTVDPDEECDGGGHDTAGCDADCSLTVCGDGYVNTTAGEQCDDVFDSPHCNGSTCKQSVCGDNYWNQQAAEQCDDGNTADGDGCSHLCQLEHCGDGKLDNFEDCDDGNHTNGDGCNAFCRVENGWNCDITVMPSKCTLM
jgi:cysteine-rich repeat protein